MVFSDPMLARDSTRRSLHCLAICTRPVPLRTPGSPARVRRRNRGKASNAAMCASPTPRAHAHIPRGSTLARLHGSSRGSTETKPGPMSSKVSRRGQPAKSCVSHDVLSPDKEDSESGLKFWTPTRGIFFNPRSNAEGEVLFVEI